MDRVANRVLMPKGEASIKMSILEFKDNNPDIGLFSRKPTEGPELDMVQGAVPRLAELFVRRGQRVAIFWEPKIDVGFPDLVIAIFKPESYKGWSEARSLVTNRDLKIVHQLYRSRGMSSAGLEQRLGITSRELLRSLERLLDAGLISRTGSRWRLKPFAEIFGVHRLIAIEAKLSNWVSAFAQAESNTWFASESFVLSPVSRPSIITRDRSLTNHVGILTYHDGSIEQITPSANNRLPLSYASWQFNEWIGRGMIPKKG